MCFLIHLAITLSSKIKIYYVIRKLLLLLFCSLSFLGNGIPKANSDEFAKKIVLTNNSDEGIKLTRDVLTETLQCYYLSGSLSFWGRKLEMELLDIMLKHFIRVQ